MYSENIVLEIDMYTKINALEIEIEIEIEIDNYT
jgi:hypothetical protein